MQQRYSYLTKRQRDGAEIFKIPKPRHLNYWMNQAYSVMLIIRNVEGEIRWMEIRNHLRQVRQIVFAGDRFDVMSVRRWRERVLIPNPNHITPIPKRPNRRGESHSPF